jgi:hypothetical protein
MDQFYGRKLLSPHPLLRCAWHLRRGVPVVSILASLICPAGRDDDHRYLLKCDAVDCCYEEDDGGPIEYQIPDVHPARLAPVTYLGQQQITLYDGSTVNADAWSWRFLIENTTAWTTNSSNVDGLATLHKWENKAAGADVINEYVDYRAVPESEAAAFKATFQIPDICKKETYSCGDAHRHGKLSAKSLAFLRAGRRRSKVSFKSAR